METLLTNKKFIKVSIVLVSLLSLFILALFVNEVKSSRYVGRESSFVNTIYVQGKGEVLAVPDVAKIYANISKEAGTTKEAQDMLNEIVGQTVEYAKAQGVEDKDIKSEFGGITPKYEYSTIYCITYPCPPSSPKITGYTASQSITITIRNVDNANEFRTGLADLGITDISGPTFTIDDETMLKDEARDEAIKDAREKAKELSKSLGVRLGKIVSFSEEGNYPIMYAREDMAMSASALPESAPAPTLPKGEQKITSTVTITYEIR
jgi:hypothetical protein